MSRVGPGRACRSRELRSSARVRAVACSSRHACWWCGERAAMSLVAGLHGLRGRRGERVRAGPKGGDVTATNPGDAVTMRGVVGAVT